MFSLKTIYLKSILAGVAVSLGGIAYGMVSDKIIAGILFSVGILLVLEYDLKLFTSYVPKERKNYPFLTYCFKCFVVFLGNFTGSALTALVIMQTRLSDTLFETISHTLEIKMSGTFLSLFILSVLCGIIIASISKAKKYRGNVPYVVLMITLFIVCGYDHIVVNCFYLVVAGQLFTIAAIPFLLINLVGNFIGGLIFSYIDNLHYDSELKKEKLEKEQIEKKRLEQEALNSLDQ